MTTELFPISKSMNYETYSLVWIDSQVNNNPEYILLQEKFRNIINYLKLFKTIDQYEEYIKSLSNYDRIILIINSQFSSEILSRIYSLKQILVIYIYGINEQYLKGEIKNIKYVELQSEEFFTELQSYENQINEPFSISIYNPNKTQDNEFICFQLLLKSLLQMNIDLPNQTHLISFFREIYQNNKNQLDIIDEFEQNYSSDHALEWYKRNTCFTKVLNKALSMENINLLILFRFFLRDIQQQIELNQYSSSIRLYQYQYILNDQLELLKNSIGNLISIKTFFLTDINRPCDLNHERILFEINVNSNLKSYCAINSFEILIMAGSIYRLNNIYLNTNEQLWIIQLELSNINDENFDYMKNKIGYNNNTPIDFITFGNILWKMDKLDQGEKYYLYILDFLPIDHSDRVNLYYNLGHIYSDKNQYDLSLKYYNKSLEIWMKSSPNNQLNLANTYNAIATDYWKNEDYKKAYEIFNKALELFHQIYGENHLTIAMCLNNMATVISNEKNYTKALDYYLKALIIFQKYFTTNHPNVASLHCNISTIYKNLNQIDSAIEHLNLSLNIYEKFLPWNHPNIPIMLKNLAFLYEQKGDTKQASICHEKISKLSQLSK